jgi:hypothetical protein
MLQITEDFSKKYLKMIQAEIPLEKQMTPDVKKLRPF